MTVENATQMLSGDYKLNANGEAELAKGIENFFAKCGDTFVVTTVTGGNFSAVATLKTETRSEQSRLDAAASATAGTASGNLSFSSDFKEVFNKTNRGVEIYRNGTKEGLPQPTAEELLKYSTDFPTKVSGKDARLIFVSVAPYSVAFGTAVDKLPDLT